MKIYRKKDTIIVEIPATQPSYDALNEYIGHVPNVVGVTVNGDEDYCPEQGIYQLIELGYKDDIQLGEPIVMISKPQEEFIALCKELNIDVWNYERCSECGEMLLGGATMKNGKFVCYEHDEELRSMAED